MNGLANASILTIITASCLIAVSVAPTYGEVPRVESVVHVVSDGIGQTPEDAERDAWRNAVGQVVGTMVDTETLVKNDKMVSDKILTYSAGYIERFSVLSRSQDGLHRVRIEAWVKKTQLTEKLQALHIAKVEIDGSSLAAQIETRRAQQTDAATALESALEPFLKAHHLTVLEVNQKEIQVRDAHAAVTYEIKVGIDQMSFDLSKKRLLEVLGRIGSRSDHRSDGNLTTPRNLVYVDLIRATIPRDRQEMVVTNLPAVSSVRILLQDGQNLDNYVVVTDSFSKRKMAAMITNMGIKVRVRLIDADGRRVATSSWVCLYDHDDYYDWRLQDGCALENDYPPDSVFRSQGRGRGRRMELLGRSIITPAVCPGSNSEAKQCGQFLIGLTNLVTDMTDTREYEEDSVRLGIPNGPVSIPALVTLTAAEAKRVVRAEAELVAFPTIP